ncbi:MAG: exosome complex protein Rrp42 [Candidatus Thorarchaeota archaeon]|nr:MAG: exosome complex protein Rrp42 [Candidatus Thorarchaeota archaeon]
MNKMGDYSTETISRIDREFIQDLIRKGERIDGRAFGEYRELQIEANVVPAKAEGSALVKLGDTSVVAGVKVLVGEPYPDSPDEGVTMVTVEMSPMASPLFELGPPKDDAIELARIVDRGVRESQTVDAKDLCIEVGKKVYTVFADVYPLEYDGNLIDACSIAVNAALLTTRFPEMKMEDKKVVATGKIIKLPIKNIAIEHTISKIGDKLIIDPILREEFVQDCRLTMAVDEKDNFTALQKGGGAGPISLDLVDQAFGMALDNTKIIRDKIHAAVKHIK